MKLGSHKKEIFWIAIIAFLVLAGLFLCTSRMTYDHLHFPELWDHHNYIYMASGHPFSCPEAPFAWRILNPLLARMLPFDIQTNFAILNFIFLWLTTILVYIMLRRLNCSPPISLAGMLFFLSLGYATKLNLYDFWLTDPLAFVFSMAAILAILEGKDILLVILLAAGVTAKESVLFTAPLYYTFNTKRLLDGKLLLRCLLISLPALLTLLMLRMFIPVTNQEYQILNLLQTIGVERIQELSLANIWSYTIGVFGISLLVLPFTAFRKNLLLFWKFLPLAVLTYLTLFVANNTERLLVFAFPVVITMAANGMQAIAKKIGIQEAFFIFLPVILLFLLMFRKDWFMVPGSIESLVILIFLGCVGIIKWFWSKKQAASALG